MPAQVQDIVTLDFHGKKRMGIVLQVGAVPGAAIVAIGYGIQDRHSDRVSVQPNTRWGRMLRIYKDTAFYARRTHVVSLECIYPTGRSCPKRLFRRLEPFVGHAIQNHYADVESEERESHNYSTGSLNVTLGDLAGKKVLP